AELDARLTAQIVEQLPPGRAADIIEEMEPDKAADILAGLSPEMSKDVLGEMPGKEAREVQELLRFEENSAVGMMTTDFIYVGETMTRAEVVEWIHSKGEDVKIEQLDTIFLVDGEKLSGIVAVPRLLLAPDGQVLAELKSEPLLSVTADEDEKEVFELFD